MRRLEAAVVTGGAVAFAETCLVHAAAGASLPTLAHMARFFAWSLGCNVVGALAIALVIALVMAALGAALASLERLRHPAIRAVFAVAAVALLYVDMHAFPHLYRAIHLAIDVAIWTCAYVACSFETARIRNGWLALLVGALASVSAWVVFRTDTNLRWVASDYAPISGDFAKLLPEGSPRVTTEAIAPQAPVAVATSLPAENADACSAPDADVVVVTVDALRTDRAFGERGARLMPALTEAARGAVVFSNAYTTTPNTSYAMSSLLAGVDVRPLFETRDAASLELRTLFDVLRARSFETAAFYPSAIFSVDRPKFAAWESSAFGAAESFVTYDDAERRVDAALTWLRARSEGSRVAMWLHLFEPHEPYAPPEDLAHGDSALERYEGEVRSVDRAFGRLFRELRALRPNTVVVFASDHGEAFGEHGGAFHGTSLYDEQTRVPLVLWIPNCAARVVPEPVSIAAVATTVLRALALPAPPSMRLPSLLVETPPVVASLENAWLARRGSKKALCTRTLDCRVYDLDADPEERFDVGANDGAMRAELASIVREHIARLADVVNGESDVLALIARARLGDRDTRERIVSLLGDDSADVRALAIRTLAEIDARSALALIERASTEDSNEVVRGEALLALVMFGADARIAAVESLVSNDETSMPDEWKLRASLALSERGSKVFAPFWIRIAADEARAYEQREAALKALGRTRSRGAREAIEPYLEHLRLRVEAANALGALGDRRALPALRRARAAEVYPLAMTAEDQAIAALSRRAMRPSR